MPLYDYRCDDCGHELTDVKQSIKDDALTLCPSCDKDALYRVPQSTMYATVSNVTTVGQVWDRKAKEAGSYHRSEVEAKRSAKQPKADKIKTASKQEIKSMSANQRERYIQTGDK
jgi:putative FmdB family regulatory protein